MNLQRLLHVIDGQEPLQRVFCHFLESLPLEPWLLELRFSVSTLYVGVDEDLDTIVLAKQAPRTDDVVSTREVSGQSPWCEAIGLPVLWAWEMRNHQGYFDGLQLEFATPERGFGPTVQMIGLASTLTLRAVERMSDVRNS